MKNDWISLEDEAPGNGWICDVLLDTGEVVENLEAEEIDDDDFMPGIGFRGYPNATHFRKAKK